jgi:hypothetical protein
VEKMTDWELFQSIASELISPNIQFHFSNEADKSARDSAASIASAYRLPIKKLQTWTGNTWPRLIIEA